MKSSKLMDLEKTVLVSLSVGELQTLIIDSVNSCLDEHQRAKEARASDEQREEILDVRQAAKLLNLAVPTMYSLISQRKLPHCKAGKKLYFIKTELIEWIRSGKRPSSRELSKGRVNNKKSPGASQAAGL